VAYGFSLIRSQPADRVTNTHHLRTHCVSDVPRFDVARCPSSVWQVRHAGYVGSHPAAFPAELVRRIIVTACDTDSLVLDPFGGSGTTALVALQHGHRAITIDNHRPFTDEARERLSNTPAHWGSCGHATTDGTRSRSNSAPRVLRTTNRKPAKTAPIESRIVTATEPDKRMRPCDDANVEVSESVKAFVKRMIQPPWHENADQHTLCKTLSP
jgi:hypothetical protein